MLGQGPGLKAPQVDAASDLVLLLRCRPSRLRRLRRRLRRKTRRPNRVSVRHAQSVFQFQAVAEVVPEAKESLIFPGASRSIFQHMPSARCPRPRTHDGDLRASPLRGRGADSDPLPFLADAHLSISLISVFDAFAWIVFMAGRLPPSQTCNVRAQGCLDEVLLTKTLSCHLCKPSKEQIPLSAITLQPRHAGLYGKPSACPIKTMLPCKETVAGRLPFQSSRV